MKIQLEYEKTLYSSHKQLPTSKTQVLLFFHDIKKAEYIATSLDADYV